MIQYIQYKYDEGVEIYAGLLQVEEFSLNDIIDAITYRLNSIPKRHNTLAYHQYGEDTCFLVALAYDLDRHKQYFEKINDKLILNFCDKQLVSNYSISIHKEKDFQKESFLRKSQLLIDFSNRIKAPLKTINEIREKSLPLYPFRLKFGRMFFDNSVYYIHHDESFCLPIRQLIEEMVSDGIIETYVEKIEFKYDNDNLKLLVIVSCKRHAHGDHFYENQYLGYIDLDKFNFIIEKHEEDLV